MHPLRLLGVGVGGGAAWRRHLPGRRILGVTFTVGGGAGGGRLLRWRRFLVLFFGGVGVGGGGGVVVCPREGVLACMTGVLRLLPDERLFDDWKGCGGPGLGVPRGVAMLWGAWID